MDDVFVLKDFLLIGSPELFFMIIPIIALLIWQTVLIKKHGTIEISDLEYLHSQSCIKAKWRKVVRATAWTIFAILLGILWIDPVVHTRNPLLNTDNQALHKNFIVTFDMSPSMNLPVEHKGFGGIDLSDGQEGTTRYETAREALFDFLQRFDGERFGLILFSTEPFLARWPTVETGNQFLEVLGDNIRRGSGTQLEAFSSLTNIDKALNLAQEILDGEGGAIIMISDAEDDVENLGTAVRRLRENNIRLYTIGVGISEEITDRLSQRFASDPGFRIFQVDSEEEMREAYRVVGEVEESPLFNRQDTSFRSSLRWVLSLFATLLLAVLVWIDQHYFHQSTNAFIRIATAGK
ncbi:MAG: hypothetical protein ACI9XC_001534 [Gammaproteobacteria bacterium]|jgi:hypothetical protein